MSIQLPGSVLSRALRSRLVRQRFASTRVSHLETRVLSNVPRFYSTANTAADEEPTEPEPEPELELESSFRSRFPIQRDRMVQERRAEMSNVQGIGLPAEGKLLMAIASGSSQDADAPAGSAGPGESIISYRSIQMELKWLEDPRALADRVARILRGGDPAKAAALVRQAQKEGKKCDVAWNHLLQYCMERGHPFVALKFYNDMKKRGRMPNARTYTIMLMGFSKAPRRAPQMVPAAHSIYRSISAENSAVKPNIIHTNAMLSVCQRHIDIKMLWRIAGDLPEEGPGAPDMTTYSIILGALQFAAREDIMKIAVNDIDKILDRKAQMVIEAKRIWADVIYRWSKEQLPLDNHVVNAMANVLLDGASDRDFYDVMALYHQTMRIPILSKIPPPTTSRGARRKIVYESKSHAVTTPEGDEVPFVDEDNQLLRWGQKEKPAEELEEEEEENFDTLFDPVVSESGDLTYPQFGSKELTLTLDACHNMFQGASTGSLYWDYCTRESSPNRIEPDALAFITYFRLLRYTRSSKTAVRVMREQMLPSGQAHGKAFHIALSSCRRDTRNLSVLSNADELLELMRQAMILPDPRALEGYMDLIRSLSETPHVLLKIGQLATSEGSGACSLQTLGRKLQAKLRLHALATLRPHVAQLHEAMERGEPTSKGRWAHVFHSQEVVFEVAAAKVMARVRSLIDEILNVDYMLHVPKNERKVLEAESIMLRKYSGDYRKSFSDQLVTPTRAQREAFKLRRSMSGLPGREKQEGDQP